MILNRDGAMGRGLCPPPGPAATAVSAFPRLSPGAPRRGKSCYEGVVRPCEGSRPMPSFDVVSKTDLNEVDNALQNIAREISTRFDFKNSKSKIERAESVL